MACQERSYTTGTMYQPYGRTDPFQLEVSKVSSVDGAEHLRKKILHSLYIEYTERNGNVCVIVLFLMCVCVCVCVCVWHDTNQVEVLI